MDFVDTSFDAYSIMLSHTVLAITLEIGAFTSESKTQFLNKKSSTEYEVGTGKSVLRVIRINLFLTHNTTLYQSIFSSKTTSQQSILKLMEKRHVVNVLAM